MLSATRTLDRSFSKNGCFGFFLLLLLLLCSIEFPVFNANSVDPDQTPGSVASDRGRHCLHTSLFMGH